VSIFNNFQSSDETLLFFLAQLPTVFKKILLRFYSQMQIIAFVKFLLGVAFFQLVSALPHFNLDLTHWVNIDESVNGVEHDCLHIFSQSEHLVNSRQILSYCLTEWPSKWEINENKFDRKYSFGDLSLSRTLLVNNYIFGQHQSI
jgi:hypothetical protein